jgi:hypothetical protein
LDCDGGLGRIGSTGGDSDSSPESSRIEKFQSSASCSILGAMYGFFEVFICIIILEQRTKYLQN